MASKDFNYQIGLDLGVASIGWAVINDENKLIRKKGKNLWGIRLFEEASAAEDRRTKRRQRRTIAKRSWRLSLLKQQLSELVKREDPLFFDRLKDSYTKPAEGYFLFDGKYNDVTFGQEFPTIYHLRLALMDREKVETYKTRGLYYRFLYLASSDILKTRGNFLSEGKLNNSGKMSKEEILSQISNIVRVIDEVGANEKALDLNFINHAIERHLNKEELEVNFRLQKSEVVLIKALLGNKFNINKIVEISEEKFEHSFNEEDWETKLTNNIEIDNILLLLSETYAAIKLFVILGEARNISTVKVQIYEKHKSELLFLKQDLKVIDKFLNTNYYYEIFDDPDPKIASYTNYVGKSINKGRKERISRGKGNQYDLLLARLHAIKKEADEKGLDPTLLKDISNENYLIRPTNQDNRFIPYQIHYNELNEILDVFVENTNVEGREKIKEHILQIMKFKVPYFVGPLANKNGRPENNYWLSKQDGKESMRITPFNFAEIVDKNATNEAFIKRMLRTCSYLQQEPCVQQETTLYQNYIFYNTINKVKVDDDYLNTEQKELLYKTLVGTGSLTKTRFKKALGISEGEISGFSKEDETKPLTISLSAIKKFRAIFPEHINNNFYMSFYDDVVDAISFVDDSEPQLKREKIEEVLKRYKTIELTPQQKEMLTKVKSKKWGNLSYKFLNELLLEMDNNTGEVDTVINILKRTNLNLMEIIYLGQNTETIDQQNDTNVDLSSSEGLHAYLEQKYISPQARRTIIQTNKLVDEIIEIMGGEKPSRIAIEFTREDDAPKKETTSRLNAIKKAYKKVGEEYNDVITRLNEIKSDDKLKAKKVHLYFLQLGKDLYTGKPINFDELMNDPKRYDIDHIFPQSRIKDDSFDNLILTVSVLNGEKGNNYPFTKIHTKENIMLWSYLKEKGLMSKKKFDRLTRKTPLTDQELEDFVNRQKTTLDWINRETANILHMKYAPESEDKQFIIYSKSRHISVFRNKFDLLKFRELNDLHHAHDAYLNIVLGKQIQNNLYITSEGDFRTYNYERILEIQSVEQIAYIRKIFSYYDPLVTKMTKIKSQGPFWDEMLVAPKKGDKNSSLIPIKNNRDVNLYGGYRGAKVAFFTIVEEKNKKEIVPIYTYECSNFYDQKVFNLQKFNDYLKEKNKELTIIEPMIPVGQKVVVDGVKMRIAGKTGNYILLHNATQLIVDKETQIYLRKLFKINKFKKGSKLLESELLLHGVNVEENVKAFTKIFDVCKEGYEKHKIYSLFLWSKINKDQKGVEYFLELSLLEQVNTLIIIITKLLKANASNQGLLFNLTYVDLQKSCVLKYPFSIIKESVTGFYSKQNDVNV